MKTPTPSEIRFKVDPGDVPTDKAARRLHLTETQFKAILPRLLARGFPRADRDTGMYDMEAIDRWRDLRHPKLFPELQEHVVAIEPQPKKSMGQIFREG